MFKLARKPMQTLKGYPTAILFPNRKSGPVENNYKIVKFRTLAGQEVVFKGQFTSNIGQNDIDNKTFFTLTGSIDGANTFGNTGYYLSKDIKSINLKEVGKKSAKWQQLFLSRIGIPKNTIADMFEQKADILSFFNMDKDTLSEELKKYKGIGATNNRTNADKFITANDNDRVLTNMEIMISQLGFNFSDSQMETLIGHFPDEDAVVDTLKNNFYSLINIKGFALATVDNMYLSNPDSRLYDVNRVKSIIENYLQAGFDRHVTWLKPEELLQLINNSLQKRVVNPEHDLLMKMETSFRTGLQELLDAHKIVIVKDVNNGRRIISKDIFDFERNINGLIKTISEDEETPHDFDEEIVKEEIAKAEEKQGFIFTDEQVNVIKGILNSNIVTINGYAGTGKSSIVRAINAIFRRHHMTITQVAFTGRAADSLSKSSGQQASTAHAALGITGDKQVKELFEEISKLSEMHADGIDTINPSVAKQYSTFPKLPTLKTDVIICDEYPTLSIKLLSALLFSAYQNHQKVILIGDSGQLPAIDFSSDHAVNESKYIQHFNLSAIKRQGDSSKIIEHSLDVREGTVPLEVQAMSESHRQTATFSDINYDMVFNMKQAKVEALSIFQTLLKQGEKLEDIIILSPLNKINDELNLTIQSSLVAKNDKFFTIGGNKKIKVYENEMIINTSNQVVPIVNGSAVRQYSETGTINETNKIFNGNVGRITEIDTQKGIMKVDFGPLGIAIFTEGQKAANALDLAYAITTHKAQGSTIKNVIGIFIDTPAGGQQTKELFSKQMLYTIMTRPSDKLFLITNMDSLNYGVSNNVTNHARSDFDIIQDSDLISKINGN